MTLDNKICLVSIVYFTILLSLASPAYPASESVFASYKYTMGDNDTKNDAKRICFLEAKRLAIEKAGTYIESSTEVKNFQLTRDEIRTFAGAIVKVDIASEEIKFVGETQVISMTVKADVDITSFRERVKQIKSDRELEKNVIDQQRQLQGMEDKIKQIQQQLTTKNIDQVIALRKERVESFGQIDELEKIKFEIKRTTASAIQNVEIGMTKEEVIRLVGAPRSQNWIGLNYGDVWVVLADNIVTIIVEARCYSAGFTKTHFSTFYNPCGRGKGIIKQ